MSAHISLEFLGWCQQVILLSEGLRMHVDLLDNLETIELVLLCKLPHRCQDELLDVRTGADLLFRLANLHLFLSFGPLSNNFEVRNDNRNKERLE